MAILEDYELTEPVSRLCTGLHCLHESYGFLKQWWGYLPFCRHPRKLNVCSIFWFSSKKMKQEN